MTGIKLSMYPNKTVKHTIKTVSSLIVPTQLIQPSHATDEHVNIVPVAKVVHKSGSVLNLLGSKVTSSVEAFLLTLLKHCAPSN